jgi:hypothetical protein
VGRRIFGDGLMVRRVGRRKEILMIAKGQMINKSKMRRGQTMKMLMVNNNNKKDHMMSWMTCNCHRNNMTNKPNKGSNKFKIAINKKSRKEKAMWLATKVQTNKINKEMDNKMKIKTNQMIKIRMIMMMRSNKKAIPTKSLSLHKRITKSTNSSNKLQLKEMFQLVNSLNKIHKRKESSISLND